MALKKVVGQFLAKLFAREGSFYSFRFTGNETFDSTTLVQDSGVISSVTRSSDGVYVLTLNPRFKRVVPCGAPNVHSSDEWHANYSAVVQGGAAANTVTVATRSASALDDSEADISGVLFLVTSDKGLASS